MNEVICVNGVIVSFGDNVCSSGLYQLSNLDCGTLSHSLLVSIPRPLVHYIHGREGLVNILYV